MKTIPLTQGKVALVDDEDYERLMKFNWFAAKSGNTFHACRQLRITTGVQRTIRMHRDILKAVGGVNTPIDHKDGNGLNNQKFNLRACSRGQNSQNRKIHSCNTSGYKGVGRCYSGWRARIVVKGVLTHIGVFSTALEAAKAYNIAATLHYGEFARLNNVEG